jgi:protein phosphatase
LETQLTDTAALATTAIHSHPGLDPDKQVNEDLAACVAVPLGLLCVVCDGMGGHANGKEAAEIAVTTIVDAMRASSADAAPRTALVAAIVDANARVAALAERAGGGSGGSAGAGAGAPSALRPGARAGSTCVAVLVHARGTEVAHVGDSRAHLIHKGTIAVITRDHSKVRAMVDAGMLTADQAKSHPDANQITRALGIADTVDVEARPVPVPHTAGDVFVLCSDGLSDLVTPDEMLEHVMRAGEAEAAEALVGVALSRGGHDNTTVAIVRVSRDAERAQSALTQIGTSPDGGAAPGEGEQRVTTERPPPVAPPPAPSNPKNDPRAADPRPTTEAGARSSRATLFIGLVLALFAIGILVALYVVVEAKKKRVAVPVPHDLTSSTAAPPASSLLPAE